MSQNRETIKEFVKLMFDDCKREIQDLRKENNDLRNENKELQRSIEFGHSQTNDLRKRIDELQSKISISHDADLSDRVMKLEDQTRKKNLRISGIVEQAGETSEQLLEKVRNVITTKLQLDGKQVISAFRSGQSSPSQPNQLSPSRAIVAKMSSYEHRTSCLKNSAKLKGSNIFLNEDVSPATQSIRNSKMAELQDARQRGLIAYFSGTKLVTRIKRSTHSSYENAASLGTEDGTASRRDNAVQDGAGIEEIGEDTGSAETGGLACEQADAPDPGLGAPLSAAAVVKKGATTRSNSVHGRFIK